MSTRNSNQFGLGNGKIRELSHWVDRTPILAFGLICLFFVLLTTSIVLLLLPMDNSSKQIGLYITTALTALVGLALYILIQRGNYTLASDISIWSIFVAVVIGTLLSGGVSESPALQIIPVPCIMAFMFRGVYAGLWASVICFLFMAVILVLEMYGVQFPQTLKQDSVSIVRLLSLMVAFAAVVSIAMVYEIIAQALDAERNREHQRALLLSLTDPLTQIANRRQFKAILNERIKECRDNSGSFLLCYFDLDGFKPVNDKYGHEVGDEVLRTVAQRIENSMRSRDLVGRHGGDEFMILIDSMYDKEPPVEIAAERILQTVSRPIQIKENSVQLSASLGIAIYPIHGTDLETLIKAADHAMYCAKNAGEAWSVYSSS